MIDALIGITSLIAVAQDIDRPALRHQCEAGDIIACGRLLEEDLPPSEISTIVVVLEGACEAGSGRACGELGLVFHQSRGEFERNDALSVHLFERGCDLSQDGLACGMLGMFFWEAREVEEDKVRATELYRLACESDGWIGCLNLGATLHYGEAGLIAPDLTQAFLLYGRACTLNAWEGCLLQAEMLMKGEGLDANVDAARDVFLRYCDLGIGFGCHLAAASYMNFSDPPQPQLARPFMALACEFDGGEACSQLEWLDNHLAEQSGDD